MNTLVSFELAKLLKEKGFDEKVTNYYFISTLSEGVQEGKSPVLQHINSDFPLDKPIWSRPTFADVVMWLYEKHGIWLSVEQNTYENKFDYLITKRNLDSWFVVDNDQRTLTSPTEAYEAAIKYTLQNLLS